MLAQEFKYHHLIPIPRYPVILSIENHCTVPQQKKMAEYLREVLQDKLDLSNINVHEFKKLPSPEILKGKVLVKVNLFSYTIFCWDCWDEKVSHTVKVVNISAYFGCSWINARCFLGKEVASEHWPWCRWRRRVWWGHRWWGRGRRWWWGRQPAG